jgi:hypothetical protein
MATSEPYPTQANLSNRLAALEERIQKLERSTPKTLTTFYNSGSNEVLMRAGTDPETEDRIFAVGRDDGGTALEVKTPDGGDTQSVRIYDRYGQVIVSDSQTYSQGLRRPSISHNVTHMTLALPAQTTTIYQTQAEALFRKSNPSVEVIYNIFSSDGATGVSLRFKEGDSNIQLRPRDGIQNYEIAHNPAPAVIARGITPPLELPSSQFAVGDQIRLIVEAYRFSGVGTFVVQVLAVRGSDEL